MPLPLLVVVERLIPIHVPYTATQMKEERRSTNYEFAHNVLRQQVFQRPLKVFHRLRKQFGIRWLRWLWRKIDGSEQTIHPDAAELSVTHHTQEDGREISVITMPPPRHCPEAFYIALIPPSQSEASETFRYMTLEKGRSDAAAPAVLGEWGPSGQHLNHGSRQYVEQSKFLDDLEVLVQRER